MAKKEWSAARELGLPITLHTSGTDAIKTLTGTGLLGPDLQMVHPLGSTAEGRAELVKNGVSYLHLADRRGAPRRRSPIPGNARSRRQDEHVDRSHHDLQLRLLRLACARCTR